MRTLTAQLKQAEKRAKKREKMLDHLLEEARVEAEKLSTLLTLPAETRFEETPRKTFEEYREDREDNEDSYFEQGVIER